MSSLRPEEDKLHSLGREAIRWKNLFIGGINANETVEINVLGSSNNALNIVTGSISVQNGNILITDKSNNNEIVNVLDKLKSLEGSVQNATNASNADKLDNLDSLDFVRSTGNVAQNITGIKSFKDTNNFNILRVTGSIDEIDTLNVPNIAWINNKLSTITISNATSMSAGKVQLANSIDIISGTDVKNSNPLVVQPSFLSSSLLQTKNYLLDEINNALLGQLSYKGALDFSAGSLTNSLNSLYTSVKDDFWYVKKEGTITVELIPITFSVGDIIIFKSNGANPLTNSMFDIIPNVTLDQISFQYIKDKLIIGENPVLDYFAKGLSSNTLVDINTVNNQTPTYLNSNNLLKNFGSNSSISNSSYDFKLSTSHLVPNINITSTPPSGDDLNKSLNINSLSTYITNHLSIDLLKDVTISSPSNSQVLQYNNGQWTNQTLNITTALSGLSDVTLTSPQDNQILKYSSSSGKWINANNDATVDLTPYATKAGNNVFTGANQFDKEIISTLTFFPTNISDYNTTNSIYRSSLNKFDKTCVTTEWVYRSNLSKVFVNSITGQFDIDSYLKQQYSTYDDVTDNYSIFHDLLLVLTGSSLQSSQDVILPSYLRFNSTNTYKTGFSIKIKLLNSPTYSIFIKPQNLQRIDGISNNSIELNEYSSLTFTVSGDPSLGWIVS
jgi:hypothetical protein